MIIIKSTSPAKIFPKRRKEKSRQRKKELVLSREGKL